MEELGSRWWRFCVVAGIIVVACWVMIVRMVASAMIGRLPIQCRSWTTTIGVWAHDGLDRKETWTTSLICSGRLWLLVLADVTHNSKGESTLWWFWKGSVQLLVRLAESRSGAQNCSWKDYNSIFFFCGLLFFFLCLWLDKCWGYGRGSWVEVFFHFRGLVVIGSSGVALWRVVRWWLLEVARGRGWLVWLGGRH